MSEISDVPISNQNPTNRILFVEDNDTLRQLLIGLLSSDGYEVLGISDGAHFFSSLAYFHPHVILLDLKLPNIDGYTILQHLQDHLEWRDIPVIVLSAMSFSTSQERALRLGAKHYLVKPVSLEQLKQAIAQCLLA